MSIACTMHTIKCRHATRSSAGFTLIELLVASTALLLIMFVIFSITDKTSDMWKNASLKIRQFRASRQAFDSMTQRLSDATLNPYLDYEYPLKSDGSPDTSKAPTRYVRQSELRFISGYAKELLGTPSVHPTHAIFFQAPLGYTENKKYGSFENLLNTWGYFIEFGDDMDHRPPFITESLAPRRYRYRLKEMMEPSENLTLYSYTSGHVDNDPTKPPRNLSYFTNPALTGLTQPSGLTPSGSGKEWFTTPLQPDRKLTRPVAENVIALILQPRVSLAEENLAGTMLAPTYNYDSTAVRTNAALNSRNQLPPIIQITMVVIDEASASRLDKGPIPPDFGLSTLFQDATKYDLDLKTLETTLAARNIGFRTFTIALTIKGAKWSRDQVN
ncbi:prepilin-type cleavage/methylation domain-containing protein [Verrucomicrobia bacterium LW23]|nr:prepilin-type cleavage/methylation domain-containing protein [Verrucomicrobia bacterium LW23]